MEKGTLISNGGKPNLGYPIKDECEVEVSNFDDLLIEWEAAKPKFKNKSFGNVIVYGTGGPLETPVYGRDIDNWINPSKEKE